jgi:ubiquinol-cytochrome c reductase cytochrome c1 subunit
MDYKNMRKSMKKSIFNAVSLIAVIGISSYAFASSGGEAPLKKIDWKFDGMFGSVDKQSAQRGLQVYKEVCAACHGLNRIAFRNLADIGFSEAEIKALAASYKVKDGPDDNGDMFERDGLPSDRFVPPFANEQAAGAGFSGKAPPDLSLIIKARHDGANYLYSLLTGYGHEKPEHMVLTDGQHYNPYFPGGNILMPPPLSDGQVTYEDGTQASVDQMSKDVVNFLQWAAEPDMESRKQMGIKVLIYLAIFTAFMYVAKRNLWKKLH